MDRKQVIIRVRREIGELKSQRAFAEKCGVTRQHLSRVLSSEEGTIPTQVLKAVGIEAVNTTTYRRVK